MEECILKVRNVQKRFDSLEVLKNINLQVNRGEVVSIIGSSGSGKTTLLRCITNLETVDGGEITIGGGTLVKTNKTVRYAPKAELKKITEKTGLVFQNFNLFPHWSILKNVMEAPVSVYGVDRNTAAAEARELLKKLGLESKENAYPYQLSGGQSQRAAIARALALKPEILFFDEPTSALDPELTGEVLKVLRALAKENITMVIVTHEMMFAKDVSDRIIFMDKGVILEDCTPEALFASSNPRTQSFLGKYVSLQPVY